jgi:hypothetical protein
MSKETKYKYKVNTIKGDTELYEEGYNETFEFYQHPEMPKNIFMKITIRTDSYGDNDFIHEIQFVEGKEKTITVYEPIN